MRVCGAYAEIKCIHTCIYIYIGITPIESIASISPWAFQQYFTVQRCTVPNRHHPVGEGGRVEGGGVEGGGGRGGGRTGGEVEMEGVEGVEGWRGGGVEGWRVRWDGHAGGGAGLRGAAWVGSLRQAYRTEPQRTP